MGLVSLKEETQESLQSLPLLSSLWAYGEKVAVLQARKQTSANTGSISTLILYFPASELWEINVCCLSHPIYDIFGIAMQTD